MINTLGYPQSLPIPSSAFTVPNSVKASQGGLKEDHSSLQALSCSTSSLGLSNGWVWFLYPGTSVLLQLDLASVSAGELAARAGKR